MTNSRRFRPPLSAGQPDDTWTFWVYTGTQTARLTTTYRPTAVGRRPLAKPNRPIDDAESRQMFGQLDAL
jgi:hypothetical protein